MTLVADVGKMKPLLTRICEQYLQHYEKNKAKISELDDVLKDPLDVFRRATSGLLALLSPEPGLFGSSFVDMQYLKKYKGDGLIEKAISEALNDEPKEGVYPWITMFDEAVSKGQTTITLYPEMLNLFKQTTAVNADNIKSLDWGLMKQCLEQRPKFKSGLRAGLINPFDKDILRVSMLAAENIFSLEGEEMLNTSYEHIDTLLKVFQLFPSVSGVLQLTEKLEKWGSSHKKRLVVADLARLVSKYPISLDALWPEELEKLPSRLAAAFFDTPPTGIDAGTLHKVHVAIAWHLRAFVTDFSVARLRWRFKG